VKSGECGAEDQTGEQRTTTAENMEQGRQGTKLRPGHKYRTEARQN